MLSLANMDDEIGKYSIVIMIFEFGGEGNERQLVKHSLDKKQTVSLSDGFRY